MFVLSSLLFTFSSFLLLLILLVFVCLLDSLPQLAHLPYHSPLFLCQLVSPTISSKTVFLAYLVLHTFIFAAFRFTAYFLFCFSLCRLLFLYSHSFVFHLSIFFHFFPALMFLSCSFLYLQLLSALCYLLALLFLSISLLFCCSHSVSSHILFMLLRYLSLSASFSFLLILFVLLCPSLLQFISPYESCPFLFIPFSRCYYPLLLPLLYLSLSVISRLPTFLVHALLLSYFSSLSLVFISFFLLSHVVFPSCILLFSTVPSFFFPSSYDIFSFLSFLSFSFFPFLFSTFLNRVSLLSHCPILLLYLCPLFSVVFISVFLLYRLSLLIDSSVSSVFYRVVSYFFIA